jgi:hypothetical protein
MILLFTSIIPEKKQSFGERDKNKLLCNAHADSKYSNICFIDTKCKDQFGAYALN